jgi:hypothetical protein
MREALGEQDAHVAQLQAQLAQMRAGHQQQEMDRQPSVPQHSGATAATHVGSMESLQRCSAAAQAGALPAPQHTWMHRRNTPPAGASATLGNSAAGLVQRQPLIPSEPQASGQSCPTRQAQAVATSEVEEHPAGRQRQQQAPGHIDSEAGTLDEEHADSQPQQAAHVQHPEAGSQGRRSDSTTTPADTRPVQQTAPVQMAEPHNSTAPVNTADTARPSAAAAAAAAAASGAAAAPAANMAAAPSTAAAGGMGDAAAAVIRDLSMRQAALAAQVQDLLDERAQLQVTFCLHWI